MRSPRRSPLISRNGRDMMLQDPAYVLKKENERRRLIRIQQVRMKSAEAARSVRQRVRREQVRQVLIYETSNYIMLLTFFQKVF